MTSGPIYQLTLKLPELRQLFVEFDIDPFQGHYRSASGVEQIMSALKAQSVLKKRRVSTTIVLPPGEAKPGLEQSALKALEGYCDVRIEDLKEERIATWREGFKALLLGVLFLGICLAGSAFLDNSEATSRMLRHFLSEGLVIAGWVGLWYPADILLYGWIPFTRDIELFRRIRAMDLHVQFAP